MALITRRGLLITAAAGTGLTVAWALWPRRYDDAPAFAKNVAVFGAYLRIATNGTVIVSNPHCEMGQGVGTVLAQIVAEELGADWRTIALEPAPPVPIFANNRLASEWMPLIMPPGWDLQPDENDILIRRWSAMRDFVVTAGDTEVIAYEPSYRAAAATARSLLCQAAADRWGAAVEETDTRDGFVVWGNEKLRFAELAEEAVTYNVPIPPPLRTALPGNARAEPIGDAPPFARLDQPGKVDGSATFAGDVRLPDMVYAAIRQGPVGATSLVSVDRKPAEGVTGLIDVIKGDDWVAAAATSWWGADKAVRLLRPRFTHKGSGLSGEQVAERLDKALDGPAKGGRSGYRMFARGEADAGFGQGKGMAARYAIAAAPHATLETGAVTARFGDNRLEIWVASQASQVARRRAANALGISEANVQIYPMPAGGSFDRRLDDDLVAPAAILARDLRRPVQLMRSRMEESVRDPVRTPAAARIAALTDTEANIKALSIKIACPPSAREFAQRLFNDAHPVEAIEASSGEADRMAVAGAMVPYDIPDLAIDHYPVRIDVPTGRWRGNAASYGVFVTETFIDELASRGRREPLSYRVQMLAQNIRLANCLTRVAGLGEWDGGMDNSGQGVACCSWNGAHIAVIASASRASVGAEGGAARGGFRVERLSAVVDAGRIINHDIALQQIEGGMIFGLAMAMGCATGWTDGYPDARALRDLSLPLLADIPEIRVDLIESQEPPAGLGEIGVPAVAPAIANALASATGLRLRQLPLLSGGL
ncbi:isoquinoline 1-oxidoreductase beta subunit [Blastomonas natatoria]|uniref:Isoquinoline 1-oxidoreductase beta subunit n=1 Tax=Blastomonas natatoria TaxID=34015 RepID=A0A2V3V0X0_9SPHN|nr:molybdopterin cofactor-binding domain-containing protein [Blastomonas natatoria]PXW75170.1 isoquinoline 1-oxidoreductase beta subunit [Blastomonas natatoria]